MHYIIIGALLAIGWKFGDTIYEIIMVMIFTKLHTTKLYRVACGKTPKNENVTGSNKVKNPIGFYQSEKK